MVEDAERFEVSEAGGSVEGAGDQVVRLGRVGGLVAAAGPLALPGVAELHGAADLPGYVIPVSHIQRQAAAAEAEVAEQVPAQVRGQAGLAAQDLRARPQDLPHHRRDPGLVRAPVRDELVAQPFGWQGRHFQFRTVSVWPRPLQQPLPPTYSLGTSRESCEFAARHHIGLGVSFAPFEVVAKSTRYYRQECAKYGWEPAPEQMIYRANILLAESDDEAHELLDQQRKAPAPFPMRGGVREALLELDKRNVAGEARTPNVGAVLPTSFYGGPNTVIEQIRRCREEVGVGVLDLMFQNPGAADTGRLTQSLELFAEKVLPHIRDL